MLRVITILYVLFFVVACNPCGNEVLVSKESYDGKYRANYFERNCGATTPFTYVVNIQLADETFSGDNFDNWIFSMTGGERPELELSWETDTELYVEYDWSGEITRKEEEWSDVLIKYDFLR